MKAFPRDSFPIFGIVRLRPFGRPSRIAHTLPQVILLFSYLVFGWCGLARSGSAFYVDYSKNVNPVHLRLYDLSILSPYADVDLAEGHKLGNQFFAYLSIGEIASDAPYREKAVSRKIPIFGKNDFWQSELVDLSHPDWTQFVIELAGVSIQKNFDGFFLDNVDTVELLIQKYPDKAGAFRAKGCVSRMRMLSVVFHRWIKRGELLN